MKYQFLCSDCGGSKEFEMSVKEYDEFTALCDDCGCEMTRVYEVPRIAGSPNASEESSDTSSSSTDSGGSCGGNCSGCCGCGS